MGDGYSACARILTRRIWASALAVVLAAAGSTMFLESPAATAQPGSAWAVDAATPGSPTADVGVEACGDALAFGQVATCPAITGGEEHVFTVTTRSASDTLFITRTRGSGDYVSASVTGPDGSYLCSVSDTAECQAGAAGTYSITVSLSGETGDYTLAVESMRTPSSCTALPNSFFSFASTGTAATLPFGAAAHCYRFTQPVGTVLHLADPSTSASVHGTIRDAQYQQLCTVGAASQCTLREPGPYRLFLVESYGYEATYRLRMPRISNSAGCPVLGLAPFGDPGTAVGSGTLTEYNEVTCHKLKPANSGRVAVRITPEQNLFWRVYTNAGEVVCDKYTPSRSCDLTAGEYTLVTQNQSHLGGPVVYQVAVAALFRNNGCAARTTTRWDQSALVVHQTSAVQTNCQLFTGRAGDRIVVYRAPTVYNDVTAWLVDSTGTSLCAGPSSEIGCVLPADGTYRVVSYLWNWYADSVDETYKLQIRRLSDAVGCPTVRPGAFGAAPAGAPGGIRCRTLNIPAAGVYLLKNVDANNYETFGAVFDSAGLQLDVCGTVACTFPAAGRYTMVLDGGMSDSVIDNDFQYAVALLRVAPSAACVAVSDTGYDTTPHRGEFLAAGQQDCLLLPSPADAKVVQLLPGGATGVGAPTSTVFDATGAYVCDSYWGLRQASCPLTGTAPFIVVLGTRSGEPTGPYATAIARVDGPPSCPVLPRDATGATVTTGPDRFAACFSVPADQHAATERFRYLRTSGTGNAGLSVFAGAGVRYCGPSLRSGDRTINCPLPQGPATVIIEADPVTADYQLTHQAAT